jgi:hypothetical protein
MLKRALQRGLEQAKASAALAGLDKAEFTEKGKYFISLLGNPLYNEENLIFGVAERNLEAAIKTRELFKEKNVLQAPLFAIDAVGEIPLKDEKRGFTETSAGIIGNIDKEARDGFQKSFQKAKLIDGDDNLHAEGYILLMLMKQILETHPGGNLLSILVEKTKQRIQSGGFDSAAEFLINVHKASLILRADSERKRTNLQAIFKNFEDLQKKSAAEAIVQIAEAACKESVSPYAVFDIANRMAFLKKEGLVKEPVWMFELHRMDDPGVMLKFIGQNLEFRSEKADKIRHGLYQMADKKKAPSWKEYKKLGRKAQLDSPVEFADVMSSSEESAC